MSTKVPTTYMIVKTSMIKLESLFGPFFDEYFNGENKVVSKSSAITTADASDKRQQQPDSTSSNSTLETTVTADGNFDVWQSALVTDIQEKDKNQIQNDKTEHENGKTVRSQKDKCMRTRSQSRNSNRQQQQVPPTFVEPLNLVEPIENQASPVVTMADNRTMAQLLEAPTEGYEDAIVVPEITADNFELKHGLVNLVQNKHFFGHDKEDPHAHIR
ncbi:hypothetical protein Tco_0870665 [Tanacetum coccineum]